MGSFEQNCKKMVTQGVIRAPQAVRAAVCALPPGRPADPPDAAFILLDAAPITGQSRANQQAGEDVAVPVQKRPLSCRPGDVLFTRGQACPGFVVVHSGSIRVSITAANGREAVLYRVGPGDVCLQTFACLLDGRAYSAEGVAETDLDAELLTDREFQRLLAEDADFRRSVLDAVARRFADYEQLIEEIALTGFDTRLARVLLRLRNERDEVHATHEGLAAETASGRAFVSRRLAEFARMGLVEPGRGWLKILDAGRLGEIANDER